MIHKFDCSLCTAKCIDGTVLQRNNRWQDAAGFLRMFVL